MNIRSIPLISETIYTSFLDEIDNEALVGELELYYLSMIGNSNTGIAGFPNSGINTALLESRITSIITSIALKPVFCREFWMYSMLDTSSSIPRHNHKTNKQLHPEEYYSFAYYPIASDDAAKIYFVANHCNTIDSLVSLQPQTSMLIVFHSYVDHYTDRHNSTNKRVCISGNYWPVEPDKSLVSDWTKLVNSGKTAAVSKFS